MIAHDKKLKQFTIDDVPIPLSRMSYEVAVQLWESKNAPVDSVIVDSRILSGSSLFYHVKQIRASGLPVVNRRGYGFYIER